MDRRLIVPPASKTDGGGSCVAMPELVRHDARFPKWRYKNSGAPTVDKISYVKKLATLAVVVRNRSILELFLR